MNIEKGKTRPDNVGIMISGQESTYSMENIVETWVDNTDFIEKVIVVEQYLFLFIRLLSMFIIR